jgi:hypothetical protein
MHLFSRNIQFNGPASEVSAHAAMLGDYVTKKSGLDVALWSAVFGAPVGTCVYSARVDGLAGVQAMSMSLAGDAEWEAMVGRGAGWVNGPVVDSFASPIHGSLDGPPPPVGAVAQVTSAVVGNGAYAEAMAWGVALAQHVEKVTGSPVMFLTEMAGTFGGVRWIGVSKDAAAADAAGAAMAGDAKYLEMLADAGRLFIPGTGHQATLIRMA